MGTQIITQPQTFKNASTVMGAAAGLSAVAGLTVYGDISASGTIYGYGSTPVATSYTFNGSTSAFAVNGYSNATPDNYMVFLDGVHQIPGTHYTASSGQIVMSEAPASGVVANVIAFTGPILASPIAPNSTVYTFNGTASAFTVNGYTDTSAANYEVFLDGVHQIPGIDYSMTNVTGGGQVVMTTVPASGVVANVLAYQRTVGAVTLSGVAPVSNDFTGNGTVSAYAINGYTNTQAESYLVHVGGLYQRPGVNYTASAGNITFTTPPPSGAPVTILAYQTMPGNVTYGSSVPGNFDVGSALTVGGKLTVSGGIESPGAGAIDTNVSVGKSALAANTTGYNNTATGYSSLGSNSSGVNNTAIGNIALGLNTTGYNNVATGFQSLYTNTTGYDNTAIGTSSLYYNTSGAQNTATGRAALFSNTTGINNVANGYQALYYNTTGVQNTAVGYAAMQNNLNGSNNVAVGENALQANTSGSRNTAVGRYALYATAAYDNTAGLGYNATVTGSNQVQLGDSSTTTFVYGTVNSRSDLRDKADVRDTVLGLDFVKALRPVDYKWDLREDYRPEPLPADASEEERAKWLEDSKLANLAHDGSKKRNRYHHGLIAQEVKELIDASGVDFGGFQDHTVNGGDDVLSIGYDELIAPMIRAIQELNAKVEAQAAEITALKASK